MDRVNVGDLIKFSKEHVNRPGHEYVKDWTGIVVETKIVGHHCPIDEMRIMWWCCGTTQVSHYDEIWWNELGYEPFEVINETG